MYIEGVMSPPSRARVAFVSMPVTGSPLQPSIQLGILKAVLARAGIAADTHSLYVDVLSALGSEGLDKAYFRYAYSSGMVLPEWLFSEQAGAEAGPRVRALSTRLHGPQAADEIARLRRFLLDFTDTIPNRVDFSGYDVVGFSMTFPQVSGSLALARRLKARHPHLKILVGGSGAQVHAASAPELLRLYPFIDVALLGEAEPTLAALVRAMLDGTDLAAIPGTVFRRGPDIVSSDLKLPTHDMEDEIFPDFDEFFARVAGKSFEDMARKVPLEVGRGCSWGDRFNCTFCALQYHGTHRKRSVDRVVAEIEHQMHRYDLTRFEIVDDLVDPPTLDRLLPRLEGLHPDLRIDYMCTRATTSARQIERAAKAGVRGIFCGIEALQDGLLSRMDKGTTAFHNVLFIKKCQEEGISVGYNVLCNLPQATVEEVAEEAALIRRIPHLQPPMAAVPVQVLRWSPFFGKPEAYGLSELRPMGLYEEIFPAGAALDQLAFVFDSFRIGDERVMAHEREVRRLIDHWRSAWRKAPPVLRFEPRPDGSAVVVDTRTRAWWPRRHRLTADEATLYSALMDRPFRLGSLLAIAPAGWTEAKLEAFVRVLDKRALVARSGERIIALAVRAGATGGALREGLFLRQGMIGRSVSPSESRPQSTPTLHV